VRHAQTQRTSCSTLTPLENSMFDVALWIAQGFLALFFLAAGLPKVIGRGTVSTTSRAGS
jgi:hypothetical protein